MLDDGLGFRFLGARMSLLRWLTSRDYRKARELRAIVRKHFRHQSDVLPAPQREVIAAGMAEFDAAIVRPGAGAAEIRAAADKFEGIANKWLQRYPNASYRENAESFLGTFALVFAVKTFFLSPMQIPTGSAQPTYYGITSEDLRDHPEVKFPTGISGWLRKVWNGESWYELLAEDDCVLAVSNAGQLKPRGGTMRIPMMGFDRNFPVPVRFSDGRLKEYIIPWAPEEAKHLNLIDPSCPVPRKTRFKKGEPIVRCVTRSGDRILVERVMYNFRQPKPGEYFVFQSSGVGVAEGVVQGTHYIKRMVGGPNDRLRVGDDRFLYVNDRRLGPADPGFEKVLGFDPTQPPRDSQYSGYVNGKTYLDAQVNAFREVKPDMYSADEWNARAADLARSYAFGVARYFPDGETVHTIKPRHYMGFGDNTMGSADSRSWGEVPEEKIIGKSCYVMWPPCNWGYESGPRKKVVPSAP